MTTDQIKTELLTWIAGRSYDRQGINKIVDCLIRSAEVDGFERGCVVGIQEYKKREVKI